MASYRLTALVILVVALLCVTPALSVQQVTDLDEFNNMLKSNDKVIVFYSSSESPFKSKIALPAFEKNAQEYAGKIVSIQVDVAVALGIANDKKVRIAPIFRIYRKGEQRGGLIDFTVTGLNQLYAKFAVAK